jgi:hypothetical protein
MTIAEGPLSNLGDLTKPATILIEKISEAVGGIFKPYQMVRVAKAEAEVGRIQAGAQIEISDLHRRAIHRFLEEEAKKQRYAANMGKAVGAGGKPAPNLFERNRKSFVRS